MAFIAYRYWNLYNRLKKDKNYSYHWSSDAQRYSAKYKPTNKIATIFYDENYNFCFEKIFSYSTKGILIQEFFDKDENGIFEKSITYDIKRKPSVLAWDKNEDALFDKIEYKLEDGSVLLLVDKNKNGIYELDTLTNQKTRP